ncbi:hypothetical protein TcG_01566 [Trypanosoma cruzi]|nr:hypothetical protein TcG_01566 [Trypanosoma cruzi]
MCLSPQNKTWQETGHGPTASSPPRRALKRKSNGGIRAKPTRRGGVCAEPTKARRSTFPRSRCWRGRKSGSRRCLSRFEHALTTTSRPLSQRKSERQWWGVDSGQKKHWERHKDGMIHHHSKRSAKHQQENKGQQRHRYDTNEGRIANL